MSILAVCAELLRPAQLHNWKERAECTLPGYRKTSLGELTYQHGSDHVMRVAMDSAHWQEFAAHISERWQRWVRQRLLARLIIHIDVKDAFDDRGDSKAIRSQ